MKKEWQIMNAKSWITNAERWIQSLLHDNYDNNSIVNGWLMHESISEFHSTMLKNLG